MKPSIFENSDAGWAKSWEIAPATVERSSLQQTRLKPTTRQSGVRPRGAVPSAGRVAVALGLVWVLVAFWVYPAHGWWRTIPVMGGTFDLAHATIRDAAGDVIAVGQISGNFVVVKLSDATGEELWRQEIDGTGGGEDEAVAVAVDASGDVIAAGYLSNSVSVR